jgi:crossover junction endodeoxyribonuclease RuvC
VPFFEYSATRIKKAIVGKGLASKVQVQRMVMHTLGLKTLTPYLDVTDALALAIGHSYIVKAKL